MVDEKKLGTKVLRQNSAEVLLIKPAGMASQLSNDVKGSSLLSKMHQFCEKQDNPQLPHRLDRLTRGVMLVALTPESLRFHNENLKSRGYRKFYLARVTCASEEPIAALRGLKKAFLKKEKNKSLIVKSGGKTGLLKVLKVTPAEDFPGEFHVFLEILTGRHHQIRVMMADLGFPLAADPVYNPGYKGKNPFYLEAVMLQYISAVTNSKEVGYWHKDPEREALSKEMEKAIGIQYVELLKS